LCRQHDARFGARALGRRLRVELQPAIAECVLHDPGVQGMRATLRDEQLHVSRQ
jgi:ATP-dependent Clp protease ATP-binding subunit ClpA